MGTDTSLLVAFLCLWASILRALAVDPVRLVSLDGRTSSLTAGRLEIQIGGTWGTVCDDGFGRAEADTACRQLGFPAGAVNWGSAGDFGYSSSSPIWLDGVTCFSDTNSDLRECLNNGLMVHDCSHSEDVILSCLRDGSLRLIDSFFSSSIIFSHDGRLEIYYNGEWGTVCDNSFGSTEADVACEQLGFSGAENYGNSLGYPSASSTTDILLDEVSCFSSDTTLLECSHNAIGVHDCNHFEDIELICSILSTSTTPTTNIVDPVRLVSLDGRSSSLTAGRLEIQIEGVWGTVCDDGFGSAEADTACRQLGFPAGAVSWESAGDLGGYSSSSRIWLDDLECSSDGSSDNLRECSHSGIGVHNCRHSEDVILSCLGDGSLRLVDTFSSSTTFSHDGRLEIYYNGEWGTVCDDSFGSTEADVACEQLGFSGAENYGNSLGYPSASFSTAILLDDVICFSSDTTLLECSHRGIGVHDCDHFEDIELICSIPSTSAIANVVGTIVGVVVAGGVFLFVCIPVCICICIACSTSKNRRRNVNTRVVGAPHSSAVVTTTTTTTAAAAQQNYGNPAPYPAAYPTQPQQAPPPHPSTVLQDAPPPSYKDVAAYPPQAAYPPPGAPYNQPPGAPYNRPPPDYNQPPGAPYNRPPPDYNLSPGVPYNQPPPGAPYDQPPGAPYNQPPGAPYPTEPAYPMSSEQAGVPSAPPPSAPFQ